MPSYKLKLWIDFCKRFRIGDLGVPLFNVTNRSVSILTIGRGPGRHVLQRSAAMDKLIVSEVQKVNDDHKKGLGRYDGLIYLMYKMRGDLVIPVYVGKALKHREPTTVFRPPSRRLNAIRTNFVAGDTDTPIMSAD
jgi:hypothetical protein